jgi:hypothetical protein
MVQIQKAHHKCACQNYKAFTKIIVTSLQQNNPSYMERKVAPHSWEPIPLAYCRETNNGIQDVNNNLACLWLRHVVIMQIIKKHIVLKYDVTE